MNKSFMLSVVAVFVTVMILGMIIHGTLLHKEYTALVPNIFRHDEDAKGYFGYLLIAHLIMAIGITWMYRAGRENRPWLGQGLRFGLALAAIVTVPMYLIYFAVQPLPSDLVAQQIVFDTIGMVIVGLVTAAVNRDPIPARV